MNITQIYDIQGELKIWAIAGPEFNDDTGNVAGDGIGYVRFYGWFPDVPLTVNIE